MSQDQLQDHTPLHLFAKLRCGWGKIAMPKPQSSVYQRPISFQEGFLISTAQGAAQHQPSDDASQLQRGPGQVEIGVGRRAR